MPEMHPVEDPDGGDTPSPATRQVLQAGPGGQAIPSFIAGAAS